MLFGVGGGGGGGGERGSALALGLTAPNLNPKSKIQTYTLNKARCAVVRISDVARLPSRLDVASNTES